MLTEQKRADEESCWMIGLSKDDMVKRPLRRAVQVTAKERK